MPQQIINALSFGILAVILFSILRWVSSKFNGYERAKSDKYFQDFASAHNWSFNSYEHGGELLNLQPLVDCLYAGGNLQPHPRIERSISTSQDGVTITIADTRVWYTSFMSKSRNSHFMFVAHIRTSGDGSYIAFPKHTPFDAFSFKKIDGAAESEGYYFITDTATPADKVVSAFKDSSVQFAHLAVLNGELYLATPYRPDLAEFARLSTAVAKILE